MKHCLEVIFIIFMIFTGLFCTVINIPDDYLQIQDGILAASNGDTILVEPDIYFENIDFSGKNILVTSLYLLTQNILDIESTVIDGGMNDSVVKFTNSEDSSAVIMGFTILNGSTVMGGGIYCNASNPTIKYNIIRDNTANFGGGVLASNSNPNIINNTIVNNSGYGIRCINSQVFLKNCIVTSNNPDQIMQSSGNVFVNYSDIQGSWDGLGNIDEDPLFLDPVNSIYQLQELSPCVNTGDPHYYIDPDGTRSDMGALFSINDAVELYADFLSDVTTGSAPLTVNFYDYSEAFNTEISSWLWDFGDDETSNNPDPVHTYLEPGLYNVSLTIEDNLGNSETITKSDYLIITAEEYTGTVWHISTDGSNIIGNGSSEYPFATIQHGMEIAVEGDTILIHPGTYYECLVFTDKNLTLSSLFLFTQDENYIQETVINGDQNGSVLSFYDPIDSTCVISGLTITNGYNNYGGGIYCDSAHPCLEHLIISDNTAYNTGVNSRGGGIYCTNSNIKISNCVIDNNRCLGATYWQGAGIFISQGNPVLINVNVFDNVAESGAGIYFCNSSPIISDSKIFDNYAFHNGGGIGCNDESWLVINNTLIYNNIADVFGAGIACRNNSFVIMANNTITGNFSYYHGGSVYLYDNSTCAIVNSILWDNEPEEIYFYHTNIPNLFYSAYSDIMGGFEGIVTNDNGTVEWLEGNIVEDPLFVCADSANYFLQAESPCIDAGISYYELEDNTILVDLAPQDYYGIAPDMGALEWFETSNEENVINNTINIIYNFPNPFNPETTISFSVTQNAVSGSDGSSFVNLAIFNVKGQKVKTLLNEHLIKGTHSVVWNGTDSNNKPVSSGIYFYKISSVNESVMKKMLLLK